LRHLVIRKGEKTGEILINLVTSSQETLNDIEFTELFTNVELLGSIKGIIHTINDSVADTVQCDEMRILKGEAHITERLLGLEFDISPFSFFQTNSSGAEKLYEVVRQYIGDTKDKIIFDLYSGTGTIAQIVSPVAKKVIGIEIVEEAVEKAKENAILNNINNCEFIAGDVLKKVEEIAEKPDIIILDPPRSGIHPKAIGKIIDFNPDTFIYVSCNPKALLVDLPVFIEAGYKVEKAVAVDMFAMVGHVECVVLMSRK
jgi:23S rRNA (uracil-5-)-methyltransferase RumA